MADTETEPAVDPMSGGVINAPPQEPIRTRPQSEVPTQPYVAPTGGEPTPIDVGQTAPPPPRVDPDALPSWQDVTQSDTYKSADMPTRLSMLQNYGEQAKAAGRAMAAQNKEDPAIYDKHVDQFLNQEKGAIRGPFGIISDFAETAVNTAAVAGKAALSETAKMAVGTAEGAKSIVYPELDLSDIGKLSVDQAKHQLGQLEDKQENLEAKSEQAMTYLQNPLAGIQDPSKRFEGGQSAAIDTVRLKNANRKRIDALNGYIASGGKEVPTQTATEALSEGVQKIPQAIEGIPIDQTYLKEHPKLAATADTVGRIAPFILGMGAAAATGNLAGEGILAEQGMNLVMTAGDAFQNGYESAEAKIEAREKNGEYFSPYEREQLKLNNASMDAFGVGSWQTASNLILSSATHGLVPETSAVTTQNFQQNLEKFFLHPEQVLGPAAAEIAGQTTLQAGSQLAANWGTRASGVSPDQDMMEGMDEAGGQGFVFGGFGAGMRAVGTSFRWGVDNFKINKYADNVRSMVDQVQAPADATNEQKFEIALKQNVPEKYQDGVRAKIALQESAKDQAQVADELDESGSSQTAQAMRDTAATTANTNVAAVKSPAQLKAEMQALVAERQAAKEAAEGKTPAKPGAKPAAPTPTEPTPAAPAVAAPTEAAAAPSEAAAPTETAAPSEAAAPTPVVSDQEINDKLGQVLGDNPTDKDKQNLATEYLQNHVYQGDFTGPENQIHRYSAGQVMHDFGLQTLEAPHKNWAKNTPETLGAIKNHLADFLDDKITTQQQAAAEQTQAAALEKARVAVQTGAPLTEEDRQAAPAISPRLFNEAYRTNNPFELIRQLKEGYQHFLSENDATYNPIDTFLYDHGIDTIPAKESGYYLDASKTKIPGTAGEAVAETDPRIAKLLAAPEDEGPPPVEEKDIPPHSYEPDLIEHKVQGAPVTASTDVVNLHNNQPEFLAETDALPPHPDETELLAQAIKDVNSRTNDLHKNITKENPVHTDLIKDAAISGYLNSLRKMKPEDDMPQIAAHIKFAIQDYVKKTYKVKKFLPGQYLESHERLTKPDEGSDYLKEAITEGQKARAAEEDRLKKVTEKEVAEGVIPPPGEIPAESGFKMGQKDVQDIGDQFFATLTDPEERRSAAYVLNKKLGIEPPKGITSARGIKQPVHTGVYLKFLDFAKKNFDATRGADEAPAGHPPGHPGEGREGDRGATDQPAVSPAVPAQPVPESAEHHAGGELRGAHPESGAAETAVRQGGETPAGQTPGVLPGAARPEAAGGVGTKPPLTGGAGAGGKRTVPISDAERKARIARESTGVVRPREGEGTPKPAVTPTGQPEPGAAGGAGPRVAPQEHPALAIAKAMFKNREVAEDHGVDIEDYDKPQELADHLEELEADQDDPEAWYKEMAGDLKVKLPEPERPATPAAQALKEQKAAEAPKKPTAEDITKLAEEVKTAKPAAKPAEKIVAKGSSTPAKINSLTEQIARAAMRDPETAADYNLHVDDEFGGEPYDANNKENVQHLADAIDASFELIEDPEKHLAALQRMADGLNVAAERNAPERVAETPAPAAPPRCDRHLRHQLRYPSATS